MSNLIHNQGNVYKSTVKQHDISVRIAKMKNNKSSDGEATEKLDC